MKKGLLAIFTFMICMIAVAQEKQQNKQGGKSQMDVLVLKDSVDRPVQDYNSSRSNRPRPISAEVIDTVDRPVQDYNSSRSNRPRPISVSFHGGVTLPSGDLKEYADNGFQAGLGLSKGISNNLELGLSTNYQQLNLKSGLQSADKSWSFISLAVGPQYTIPMNQFFIQLHGHLGVNFIKTPAINQQQAGKPDYFKEDMTVFQLEKGNATGFYADAGIKAGVSLSDKVNFFIGSTYSTNLNEAISYQQRDLSNALHESGEVHVDIINSTPFEKKNLSFSNLGIKLGVSINIGKAYVQDYNSSRGPKKPYNDTTGRKK